MAVLSVYLAGELAGCAGSVASVASMDVNELRTIDNGRLCATYGDRIFGHGSDVRSEIEVRGLISKEDWALVNQRQIRIGMSECAMLASWGAPGTYGGINRTMTANGSSIQWIYRAGEFERATYVNTHRQWRRYVLPGLTVMT